MKTFEIKLTQELKGYYHGVIQIEAESAEQALEQLKSMSNQDIDSMTDWTMGDEYDGDPDTIEINEESIEEIETFDDPLYDYMDSLMTFSNESDLPEQLRLLIEKHPNKAEILEPKEKELTQFIEEHRDLIVKIYLSNNISNK